MKLEKIEYKLANGCNQFNLVNEHNLIVVLHQFYFVITGKFSACLTTTDVKHSDVSSKTTLTSQIENILNQI